MCFHQIHHLFERRRQNGTDKTQNRPLESLLWTLSAKGEETMERVGCDDDQAVAS